MVLLGAALMVACGSAPVQEMSDARQAIQAAVQAGADEYAKSDLVQARRMLSVAEHNLERGDYSKARHYAVNAREQAQLAREQAQEASGTR